MRATTAHTRSYPSHYTQHPGTHPTRALPDEQQRNASPPLNARVPLLAFCCCASSLSFSFSRRVLKMTLRLASVRNTPHTFCLNQRAVWLTPLLLLQPRLITCSLACSAGSRPSCLCAPLCDYLPLVMNEGLLAACGQSAAHAAVAEEARGRKQN